MTYVILFLAALAFGRLSYKKRGCFVLLKPFKLSLGDIKELKLKRESLNYQLSWFRLCTKREANHNLVQCT